MSEQKRIGDTQRNLEEGGGSVQDKGDKDAVTGVVMDGKET